MADAGARPGGPTASGVVDPTIDPDEDPALRELDQGRGPCTGRDATPRIRGLVETAPAERWTWRDRRWVLDVVRRSQATHYLYASELDPFLNERWRRPFGASELGRFAALVEDRVAVMGVALSPTGLDVEDPAAHVALAGKVDQLLDVGFELVVVRFDRQADGPSAHDQVRLVEQLWGHVEGRADLVVVPRDLAETWSTPDLEVLGEGLPREVLVAWCGPSSLPTAIRSEDLLARRDATGGRPPFVWDDYGVHQGAQLDRLALGPYLGREPEALAGSGGWVRTLPAIARTTVPQLISYSGWLAGRDPVETWEEEAGDLRHFVEGCEGRVPRHHANEVVEALGTPDWVEPMALAVEWMEGARTAETPHMGSGVRRWRTHLREEAEVALLILRGCQALQPVAMLGPDGAGRAVAPATEEAALLLALIVHRWKLLGGKATSVMGERAAIDVRSAPTPSGRYRIVGPILVEGRNATDIVLRAYLGLLEGSPLEEPALVVEAAGASLDVSSDGSFAAPPGESVLVRWGDRSTRLAPGAPLPFPDDARLGPAVPPAR